MRIKEIETRSGFFWKPSAPEHRLPGMLSVSDGGEIRLELVGHSNASLGGEWISRLVGVVEDSGYVTLEGCVPGNSKWQPNGVSKTTFRVSRAFFGVHFGDDETIELWSVDFSVEGLIEWLHLSGIQTEFDWDKRTAQVSLSELKPIEALSTEEMAVSFCFPWSLSPTVAETRIVQKAHIRIESKIARPLDAYARIMHRITNLLCFAMDETACIDSIVGKVMVTQIGDESEEKLVDTRIVYQSLPYVERPAEPIWHLMLFRYGDIKDSCQERLSNWFSAYDVYQPALSLYFSSRAGDHKYLDGRFLSLAQALETFHRRTSDKQLMAEKDFDDLKELLLDACPDKKRNWLGGRLAYANELSLRQRLKDILAPFAESFGNKSTRRRMLDSIVTTRNYLTHYDIKLKDKTAKGRDLYQLCMRMEALLQLHFLSQLGFPAEEVASFALKAESLQEKLSF
jgi:hypothetical protein